VNQLPTLVTVLPLGEGDTGVDQTVRAMIGLIDRGKKSGIVRARAARILHDYHVRAFDFRREFKAVFDWAKRNIRFTRDPTGKEGLHSADTILDWRIGDCDDFSILVCSLLGTIGHRCRLVAISSHPEDPTQFSHIYPEVQLDGRWITVDLGRRKPVFGRSPSHYFRKRAYDIDTGESEDLASYGVPRMTRRPMQRMTRRAMRLARGGIGSFATPQWAPTIRGRIAQIKLRGLGQSDGSGDGTGWDWSQFEAGLPALTSSITSGITNIIRAQNTPSYPGFNPLLQNPTPYGSPSVFGGISTGTLLLGGLGLALVLAMGRDR
jgi:hypothetical protein